jgi:hypothetical protein
VQDLGQFWTDNVDFVKIDVDGFEVPLLEGARETLTRNTPVINIEMKRDKRPGHSETSRGYIARSRLSIQKTHQK